MAKHLSRLTPGASRSVHLFVAALIWTVVGGVLILRGVNWLLAVHELWIVIPSLCIGTVKSLYMLDRSALKNINRILETREGRCLGGVYSLKTWMLVLLMMTAGWLMRHSSLPLELLGLIYVSIGWGLLFSSRHAWLSWRQGRTTHAEVKGSEK